MKAIYLTLIGSALFGFDLAQAETIRYGLFVGKNEAAGRATLRYAEKDVSAMTDVMSELGGVDESNTKVLKDPTKDQILRQLSLLTAKISAERKPGLRQEFVWYYSGHANEESLMLGDEIIPYVQLQDWIKKIPADVKIVVLDACSSGSFITQKGGVMKPAFLTQSQNLEGKVILASSSRNEASQESDRIRGAIFTHHLTAGLRGAADYSKDKKITLSELYQYAYSETLKETGRTLHGSQHPNYSIQLTGTGDLVLTDVQKAKSSIYLGAELEGVFMIQNDAGEHISELKKSLGKLP
jgi:hypothetical protein